VAKDQNVRLRSGWFSERDACYLASGIPVVAQDTGFSNILPTGEGLFAFVTMDEILGAVDAINSDYQRHCTAARAIAEEYFRAEKVAKRLLADLGF
jgi:glycosyltransferase involved in cell wall biosynthesis